MARWVVAALLLVIAAGWVAFLNPDPVVLRFTPEGTTSVPLAGALLAAFGAGALLVGLVAGFNASARGWHGWRSRRRARREAKRAARAARAEQLVWKGDYAQARAELLRLEGDAPTDAGRLVLLAETHLHEGDPAAARRLLEDGTLRLGPEPRLLALLAEAAEREGDLRAAAEALERARQTLPDSPRLARRLRDVYMAAGRWPEALALQGQILLGMHAPAALAVEERTLRGLRYQNALAGDDPLRAARVLVGLAREDRAFVPAWVSAGDLYARAGRKLKARRVWEKGAVLTTAPVLLDRIERVNRSEKKPARTARFYRRLRHLYPDEPGIALLFARHLILTGDLQGASTLLESLPPKLTDDPRAHALWAEVHRRRGNHDVAANSYALACGPDLGVVGTFHCTVCNAPAKEWQDYCAACRQWGTFRSDVERT
jgi:predicted Zn-dependent protease